MDDGQQQMMAMLLKAMGGGQSDPTQQLQMQAKNVLGPSQQPQPQQYGVQPAAFPRSRDFNPGV